MHPQNVMKNMTTPTTIRMTAGSTKNVSRTVSGRERRKESSPYLHVSLLLLPLSLGFLLSCSSSVASPLISIHLLRIMQTAESLEQGRVNLFSWHLMQTTN